MNFNGTGSSGANQTIRGSSGVSSIYKSSQGEWTINFSPSLPDANYSATTGFRDYGAGINQDANLVAVIPRNGGNMSSSSIDMRIGKGVLTTLLLEFIEMEELHFVQIVLGLGGIIIVNMIFFIHQNLKTANLGF